MKKFGRMLFLLFFIATSICAESSREEPFEEYSSSSTCTASNKDCWPSASTWEKLNTTLHGLLIAIEPPGKACYSGPDNDPQKCKNYQSNYLSDLHRESYVGTMQNTNWETCGDDQCLLPVGPLSKQMVFFSSFLMGVCSLGALPHYALIAQNPQDIAAVIQFAKIHRIALNIKNTGHDYLGRSTSPNSITIWTHELDSIVFHESYQSPCNSLTEQHPAFTFGAGVNWFNAYQAAHAHNVTVVGGAQAGVGVAGGWLQGGGHSMLSPAYGLGVDHVLEFKVVLSNGDFVTANACSHPDLFWALRGGGGGSFGVVTEVTVRAHPRTHVQLKVMSIWTLPLPGAQRNLLLEFARHSKRWAEEGWGGYFYYYGYNRITFVYGNPLLTEQEALESMKPFEDFVKRHSTSYKQLVNQAYSFDDFYDVFMKVLYPNSEMVGHGARISSRLIPQQHFANNTTIETLIDAFLEGTKKTKPLSYFLPTQILATTSLRVKDENKETSVQPLFRDSVWHVIYTTGWEKGVPSYIKRRHALAVSQAADPIRKITPGGGAYMNEADVREPNWQQSFWGDENYARLSVIKKRYDPDNVFHCWKCIGWDERMIVNDEKYKCYRYN